MPAGGFYHAGKIVKAEDVAGDVPPEIFILLPAGEGGIDPAEIFVNVFLENHVIPDPGINDGFRILNARLDVIAKMTAFPAVRTGENGRQGDIHNTAYFAISGGDTERNSGDGDGLIFPAAGVHISDYFIQGFEFIHQMSPSSRKE